MYRIEKIGENKFYIKVLGLFPPSVAKDFIKDFRKKTKKLEKFSVIVDGSDFIFLNLESFGIILDYLKENNQRLDHSSWIVSKNPPLDIEIETLLKRAESPKRKIVETLEEAKEWIGVSEITIIKD
ncbi:MAG: hypothetical protein ACXAAH_02040 [Promethearchaeota archaeon]|jgi:hypothetical protein